MSGSRRRVFDIVIAGGGLVGASLACALSGQGLRVAVIESHAPRQPGQPSYDDRKIALALASVRIFDAVGVWNGLKDSATPIERIHVSDHGHFGTVRIHASDYQVPALGWCVEARLIGQAILQRLSDCEDVAMFAPASFAGIELADNCVQVTLEHDGVERRIKSQVLVGADGTASAVRDALAIEADHHDYAQVAVVTNVTPERPHGNWAYERLTRDGPLALLPMSGQRCGLIWTVAEGEEQDLLSLDEVSFLDALQQRFGYRLGRFVRAGRRVSYPLSLVTAAENVANRAVLIGNAAHTIHPVSAQGFNLGLRDAAALAEHLVARHRAGEDIGDHDALMDYQRARDPDQAATIRYTDSLVRQFSRRLLPFALMRSAAMVAMDVLPPVKNRLVRQTMGYAGSVPRLARGLPL